MKSIYLNITENTKKAEALPALPDLDGVKGEDLMAIGHARAMPRGVSYFRFRNFVRMYVAGNLIYFTSLPTNRLLDAARWADMLKFRLAKYRLRNPGYLDESDFNFSQSQAESDLVENPSHAALIDSMESELLARGLVTAPEESRSSRPPKPRRHTTAREIRDFQDAMKKSLDLLSQEIAASTESVAARGYANLELFKSEVFRRLDGLAKRLDNTGIQHPVQLCNCANK